MDEVEVEEDEDEDEDEDDDSDDCGEGAGAEERRPASTPPPLFLLFLLSRASLSLSSMRRGEEEGADGEARDVRLSLVFSLSSVAIAPEAAERSSREDTTSSKMPHRCRRRSPVSPSVSSRVLALMPPMECWLPPGDRKPLLSGLLLLLLLLLRRRCGGDAEEATTS